MLVFPSTYLPKELHVIYYRLHAVVTLNTDIRLLAFIVISAERDCSATIT